MAQGSVREALAFWVVEPGVGEVRSCEVPLARPGEVLVRARCSAISRGTESLVFHGRVPVQQRDAMRAPHQEGDFPGPVKYGYLGVGVVAQGPEALRGRTVFCLHPHQSAYVVPASDVIVVPDGVPAERAALAGTVETALNALWDCPPLIGDRVAVVGAGMVGCTVARLLARVPAVDVTLVDTNPARAAVAEALEVAFALPVDAPEGCDMVVHTSATAAGLQRALELAAPEATVLEMSWYGDASTPISLGGVFHSRRLVLRSTQVGQVAPRRRDRRSSRARLSLALDLLADPVFDELLSGRCSLRQLPEVMPRIANGSLSTLCHLVTYEDSPGGSLCSA